MPAAALRRWSYRLSALLGAVYAVYVVVLKLLHRASGGPLGDVGEFALVGVCITAFAVGLFADEAHRHSSTPDQETP